jgi:hypothetical protein
MPWTSKIGAPITLRDGREIVTLRDAADLILSLPEAHQARPYWVYAAELLLKAAEPGQTSIKEAHDQFLRALKGEGLI